MKFAFTKALADISSSAMWKERILRMRLKHGMSALKINLVPRAEKVKTTRIISVTGQGVDSVS